MKKKEAEKKATKLKQDDVDRRLYELNAELNATGLGSSDPLVPATSRRKFSIPDLFSKSAPTAVSSGFNMWAFWLITLVSLILSQTPGISWLFTPINQFTTMVHELSHAIVCILTGGHVTGLTIVGDGAGHGGLTNASGGIGFFFVQAGYLGTAVFGCLLIYLGQFARFSKIILGALGVTVALCTIFLVGFNVFNTGWAGVFSFLWGAALSAALLWMSVKLDAVKANLAVLFIAIQTALNSISCIFLLVQVYCGFLPAGGWSDATVMQSMTGLPQWFWSLIWFLMSCAMLGFTLWHTYGKRLFSRKANLIETRY